MIVIRIFDIGAFLMLSQEEAAHLFIITNLHFGCGGLRIEALIK